MYGNMRCPCAWTRLVDALWWLAVGKLRRLYKTALRLEVAFFDAQHAAAASPRIGMLVTDFDDTCTASDTISTIIQTATEAKVRAAEASGRKSHTHFLLLKPAAAAVARPPAAACLLASCGMQTPGRQHTKMAWAVS